MGFSYYVFGEHPDYIRKTVCHPDIHETLTHIGWFHKLKSNLYKGTVHVQLDRYNSIETQVDGDSRYHLTRRYSFHKEILA